MHFLLTTRVPRSSFPADITPAETALMREHVAYWTEMFGAGKVVVFGPVSDPAGAWGMAVLECAGEAEARELIAADPAVSGQLLETQVLGLRAGAVRS